MFGLKIFFLKHKYIAKYSYIHRSNPKENNSYLDKLRFSSGMGKVWSDFPGKELNDFYLHKKFVK